MAVCRGQRRLIERHQLKGTNAYFYPHHSGRICFARHVGCAGLGCAGGHSPTEAIQVASGQLTVRNSLFSRRALAIKRTGGGVNEDYDLFLGGGGAVAGYFNGAITSGGRRLGGKPQFVKPGGDNNQPTFFIPARESARNPGVPAGLHGGGAAARAR